MHVGRSKVEASTSTLHTSVETFTAMSTRVLCRVLVEGGGLKFVFGDENTELDIRPDSSSSADVRRFLFECFAQKLCIFSLFLSSAIGLVVVSGRCCRETFGLRRVCFVPLNIALIIWMCGSLDCEKGIFFLANQKHLHGYF